MFSLHYDNVPISSFLVVKDKSRVINLTSPISENLVNFCKNPVILAKEVL